MKRPSSKIREEIAKLQEQLKAAETKEAERIGRLALKAGLGDVDVEDGEIVAALEEIAGNFRKGTARTGRLAPAPITSGAAQGQSGET